MDRCVMALGTFDGVHLGHQKVIAAAKQIAQKNTEPLVVFTFCDHPRSVLTGQTVGLLTTPQARRQKLTALGADRVAEVPFQSVRQLSPEAFLYYLIGQYGADTFVCGSDYRFGVGGKGDFHLMQGICRQTGTTCRRVEFALDEKGEKISSRVIREYIRRGDMRSAEKALGAPFAIFGDRQKGKGLAHRWGTPTVNIPLPEDLVVPKFGVYAATAVVDGKTYPAVCNIGIRPSFDDGETPNVETYLISGVFEDIGAIEVRPHIFLRPEQKFETADDLRRQITDDIAEAKRELCVK